MQSRHNKSPAGKLPFNIGAVPWDEPTWLCCNVSDYWSEARRLCSLPRSLASKLKPWAKPQFLSSHFWVLEMTKQRCGIPTTLTECLFTSHVDLITEHSSCFSFKCERSRGHQRTKFDLSTIHNTPFTLCFSLTLGVRPTEARFIHMVPPCWTHTKAAWAADKSLDRKLNSTLPFCRLLAKSASQFYNEWRTEKNTITYSAPTWHTIEWQYCHI